MQALADAMHAKDVPGMLACMRPDVELHSPITRRISFRGIEQVGEVLETVYALAGPVEVIATLGEGRTGAIFAITWVAGHPVDEAILVELDDEGLVSRLTLYVRAMPQLVTFAAVLAPRLGRRRGPVRALALKALFAPIAALVRGGEPIGVRLTGAGTPTLPATEPVPGLR